MTTFAPPPPGGHPNLGNAVVPHVGEVVGRLIVTHHQQHDGKPPNP